MKEKLETENVLSVMEKEKKVLPYHPCIILVEIFYKSISSQTI